MSSVSNKDEIGKIHANHLKNTARTIGRKRNAYDENSYVRGVLVGQDMSQALNGGNAKMFQLGLSDAIKTDHRLLQAYMIEALANVLYDQAGNQNDARNEFWVEFCEEFKKFCDEATEDNTRRAGYAITQNVGETRKKCQE
jgi:hypothetical protein